MALVTEYLSATASWIWGWPLIILLFGTHLFLTVRLGFIQRFIGLGLRYSVQKEEGKGDISHFASLATALAATIGTGNIIGVATAVASGGPGAVLWMWLTGVFGIATKYTEALLSVHYRVTSPDGRMMGGPMYVLERGLGWKWLGVVFAACTVLASFGIGNMTQAHSIVDMLQEEWAVQGWQVGLVLSAVTALVILGGIQSIAKVCTYFVPFMAAFYVLGCLYILAANFSVLPGTLALILESAFNGQAALGGFVGAGVKEAMRFGIARGLFSNESGMGSAPIVAAAAKTSHPVRQALVSATGTFWDTVVICALTGLVIVSCGDWQSGLGSAALTKSAFHQTGLLGRIVLEGGLLMFVLSTIFGWSYYGERALEYLVGSKGILPYRVLWVGAVFVGSTATLDAVWAFSDIANAMMAVPNLIAVLALSGLTARLGREYFADLETKEKAE